MTFFTSMSCSFLLSFFQGIAFAIGIFHYPVTYFPSVTSSVSMIHTDILKLAEHITDIDYYSLFLIDKKQKYIKKISQKVIFF